MINYIKTNCLLGIDIERKADTTNTLDCRKINVFIGLNNSGKSRLLRSIFRNMQHIIENNSVHFENIKQKKGQVIKILSRLVAYFEGNDDIIYKIDSWKKYFEQKEIDVKYYYIIDFLTLRNTQLTDPTNNEKYYSVLSELEEIFNLTDEDKPRIIKLHPNATYIPTLRGLKPLINSVEKNTISLKLEQDHYKERVLADYFKGAKDANVYSGLNIYYDIRSKLLGSENDRILIRSIENFLELHVFNQKITLTPKIDDDILHIKIGNEVDRRISDLGDGIQTILSILFPILLKKDEEHYFFIEEPETNLHAKKQVQILNLLANDFPKHQYFISSHSAHFLKAENLNIFKVENENSKIKISTLKNSAEIISLLNELGYSANDLFQSNYLIWVEGPSDVIYFEYFLSKLLPSNFKLNTHYTILMYGGKTGTSLWSKAKIENILAINRNCSVLADSDRTNKADKCNVEDLFNNIKSSGIHSWVTPYREIENHLDKTQLLDAIRSFQGYEKSEYVEKGNYGNRFKVDTKVMSNDIKRQLYMTEELFNLIKSKRAWKVENTNKVIEELKKSISFTPNIVEFNKKVKLADCLIKTGIKYDEHLKKILNEIVLRIKAANR